MWWIVVAMLMTLLGAISFVYTVDTKKGDGFILSALAAFVIGFIWMPIASYHEGSTHAPMATAFGSSIEQFLKRGGSYSVLYSYRIVGQGYLVVVRQEDGTVRTLTLDKVPPSSFVLGSNGPIALK
ncbi:MAG: hypothetical protein AAB737_02510 [Patescibacteria group bacterium]